MLSYKFYVVLIFRFIISFRVALRTLSGDLAGVFFEILSKRDSNTGALLSILQIVLEHLF